ncbi:putative signal-transduction protein with CBS domains [Desulforamulus reducens MI-1]|uniref:Putative signal-transduction protein with CBS domains n=1 Tax=Desulforamulus reducens (strain ATCC BAA-1160 / DSM 100696 / MI-1) TaxID=349161 RepID=A4J7C8_DESRM|nr:helix-turn-helix transcriptional regulator [Desulforamulus reducens]ABO50981.1 putative signal-transduction protein with CBS domains [Desulforamulus reducens MI-1]
MELSKRQETIIEIVKNDGPITGEQIAERLNLTRATLRPDLSILTMAGFLEARPRVGYYYNGKTADRILAEKITRLQVGEVKSVPTVVSESCSVYDAVVTMFIEDVGTLYIVREGGLLEGVVSRKDLLKTTLGGQDIHKLPLGVIMTRMPNIHMVQENDSVWLAAHKLLTHEIDSLPVVRTIQGSRGKDYEVIGRFSKTNVTRLFVEFGEGS